MYLNSFLLWFEVELWSYRARFTLAFCPPLRVAPLSPITVRSPSGSSSMSWTQKGQETTGVNRTHNPSKQEDHNDYVQDMIFHTEKMQLVHSGSVTECTVGDVTLTTDHCVCGSSLDFFLGFGLSREFFLATVLLHLHWLLFGVLGWVSVQHFEISADVRRAI
jgi:hypothetical protein